MELRERIEKSIATVAQMAVLTGLPSDRIYKWKQGKSDPQADEDIEKMGEMFQSISNLSKKEIKEKVAEIRKENKSINNPLSSLPHKTGEAMMNRILLIMERHAIAAEKDAEARLLEAKSKDRLTLILERMERKLEGEEMHVKPMEA